MTGSSVSGTAVPFPGLRPFNENETHLFFGRERQVDAMVDTLAGSRFLAVVGTSGSGKSSLVNCGLIPGLHKGLMAGGGSSWRIAKLRPENDPIGNLAGALCKNHALYDDDDETGLSLQQIVETNLRMSKLGLVDVVKQARLGAGVNLVVIVDQFEELFRYSKLVDLTGESTSEINQDAVAFVNLLLQAVAQADQPIYVVLTMRSDFLGDCAKFSGLPEAINASQFLVPRLTRNERRAAIVGPVRVARAEIRPVLVTRLVNDASDKPDQLSVLQHALNRTWSYWQHNSADSEPIGIEHYEAIGSITDALNAHAEQAFSELGSDHERRVCELVFKALTDKATDPRGIRRPTKFKTLMEVVNASDSEVAKVLEVFRKPSRSFLLPPAGEDLQENSVVDISHESLMRGWRRLRNWADEEARSAQLYLRLAATSDLYGGGQANLLRDPELQLAIDWKNQQKPSEAWARQYGGRFGETMRFLDSSTRQKNEEIRRKFRVNATVAATVAAVAVLIGGSVLYGYLQRLESQQAKVENERVKIAGVITQKILESGRSLRETERDPINGALIALRALHGMRPEHDRALPALENALWQAHSLTRLQKVILDHDREIRSIAFSTDGQLMATGSYDGNAFIYDTGSWQRIVNIEEDAGDEVKSSRILGLTFSPDGNYLATGSSAYVRKYNASGSWYVKLPKNRRVGRIRLWDTKTGKLAREFKAGGVAETAHDGPVRTVRFNTAGDLLATSSYDNTARIWNVETGKLVDTLQGHAVRIDGKDYGVDVYDAAFHPSDPSILASVGNDGKLRVWDMYDTANGHIELGGHNHRIKSVAFTPDGNKIVTSSDDDTVRVWDYRDKRQDGRPLAAHIGDVWQAIFDDDGKFLITASWDRTVGIWDAESFSRVALLSGHLGPVRTVAYNPVSRHVVSGSTDKTARIWSLEADDFLLKMEPHGAAVTVVRANPADLQEFATAGEDGKIKLWKHGEQTNSITMVDDSLSCAPENWTPKCAVSRMAFSKDGKRLAALYDDSSLRIWNTSDGQMIGSPVSNKNFRTLRAVPDHGLVAVGTTKGTILFFQMGNAEPALRKPIDVLNAVNGIPGLEEVTNVKIESLDYNQERQILAAGLNNGVVLTLDIATGELADKPIQIGQVPITSVRFDSRGQKLFAASWNLVIEAWDLAKNTPLEGKMEGHRGIVKDMDLIDGGKRLVTASADETIRIWDTEAGRELVSLPGHSGTVRSVAVVARQSGETHLISGSEDNTVVVRHVFEDLSALKRSVCDRLRTINLEAWDPKLSAEIELEVLCSESRPEN